MVRNSNKMNKKIDHVDLKILEILEENSREPFTRIAKILNMSEAAIRKRVNKLEKLGIIKKYTIEIDYFKIGFKVCIIGIDVLPEYLTSILNKLRRIKEIKQIYLSSGDHDIMVKVIYSSSEKLERIVENIKKMEGVLKVCPAILIEKIL